MRNATSKEISFVAMMGALGNVLAALTIAPTAVRQIALDFSSLPVLLSAALAGPIIGAFTGIVAGLLPSFWFGFVGGQLGLLGFSASIGKAIHGLAVGYLVRALKPFQGRTLLLIPIVLIGFVPEALWIVLVFTLLAQIFLPNAAGFLGTLVVPILVKATFEVAVMSFFMTALAGHTGFKKFVITRLLPEEYLVAQGAANV